MCERMLYGLAAHSKRPSCVGQADVLLRPPFVSQGLCFGQLTVSLCGEFEG